MKKTLLFNFFIFGFLIGNAQDYTAEIRESYSKLKKHLYHDEKEKSLKTIKELENKIDVKSEFHPVITAFYSNYYLNEKEYKRSFEYANRAYKQVSKTKNNDVKAILNYFLANYYHRIGDYTLLTKYSLKALDYAIKTNFHRLLGDIYYKLYCVHTQTDDIKTDEYAQKSLDSYKKIKYYDGIVNAYNAKYWGVENLYHETKNLIYLDSIHYFRYKSFTFNKEHPNKISEITNAYTLLNLADYQLKLFRNKKINENACRDSLSKYLKNVDAIKPKYDRGYIFTSNSANIKATFEFTLGNYDVAEKIYLKSYKNLKSFDNKNYYSLFNTAIGLKEVAKHKKDYNKAYKYLKDQYLYYQEMFDEKQTKQIKILEAKFQNEKIQQKLVFEQKENKSKRIQLYLVISLLIFSLIAIFFMVRAFKNRMLAKQRKVELLAKEKQEAIIKIKLQEEKYTRLLAERKVLETDKEKIQKQAMVSAIQIERKNQLLDEIQKKLIENNLKSTELRNSLKIEKYNEEQLANKVDGFSNINPDFFEKLNKLSNNKLTPLDLRYCAYFYLGLSNTEIANNLNVEAKSVRMSKYRIKKKLNLDKNQELNEFLKYLLK